MVSAINKLQLINVIMIAICQLTLQIQIQFFAGEVPLTLISVFNYRNFGKSPYVEDHLVEPE